MYQFLSLDKSTWQCKMLTVGNLGALNMGAFFSYYHFKFSAKNYSKLKHFKMSLNDMHESNKCYSSCQA